MRDRGPSLAQDSAGRLHMLWQRNGQFWHAVNEGAGWVNAQPIAGAVGGQGKLIVDPLLIDGQTEGLIAAWQQGDGNDSEIYYSIGKRADDGRYVWTPPVPLTRNGFEEGAYAVGVGADGNPLFLMQRRDASIVDGSGFSADDWSCIAPRSASPILISSSSLSRRPKPSTLGFRASATSSWRNLASTGVASALISARRNLDELGR